MPEDLDAHFLQMERDRQQQEADRKKAVEVEQSREMQAMWRAKEARWETFQAWGIGLVIAAFLLGLAYIIWQATEGPSDQDLLEKEMRTECLEYGGTWFDSNGDSTGGSGHCIMPGVSTK